MAPITEEVVSGLKDTIGKLEARIEDLEGRLTNGNKPKSIAEQMRIILMGPPGAGTEPARIPIMISLPPGRRPWVRATCG